MIGFRAQLVGGVGLAALTFGSAMAQAPAPTGAGEAEVVGEVLVTGTRVKRDGYSAPTPETVITAAEIQNKAPANIADYVNQLPALAANSSPRTATINVSSGSAGSNFLDLRGLGANRTLVLLDGRRVVGANAQQAVDANTLPSTLISRIDIVTGGASAAYGSDAVSGVVNFVLDTKFKGLKASIQAGETQYGDDFKWRADLAAGTAFADGRGHVVMSGSYSKSDGATAAGRRPWFESQKVITNPAFAPGNGQPRLIVASNVSINNAAPGGLITTGVLRGTQFLAGGDRRQFNFGTTSGAFSLNADPNDLAGFSALDIPLEQHNLFGRVSFEVSDSFRPYAEASYSKAVADSIAPYNFFLGNLTIQRDNAFLPDDLRARLTAAGQASFGFGTWPVDLGRINPHNAREVQRYAVGADGDLGGSWTYSAYAQYGRTDIAVDVRNDAIVGNFRRAIDAVRNASGSIVCRVNVTTVTDAGCTPFNPFGTGVASPAAIAYVTGVSQLDQVLEQSVFSGSVQGEPFSTWAGPVSIATGIDHRREEIRSSVDALSLAGAFQAGNYKPTNGKYEVTEGFVETVVPLAKDLAFAKALDLNAAYRRTHYSTSGSVNTWKVGLTWSPIEDLRLRGTRSRDIRAPNLNDLYQGGVTSVGQTVIDRATGQQTINITAVLRGNAALQPEIADSLTVGFIAQPSAIPGLSFSADYYDIKIRDAIQTLSIQQIVDRCVAGNAALCAGITRNAAGVITGIDRFPFNIAKERVRGFDIEAGYSKPLEELNAAWSGRVSLRVLATRNLSRYTDDGLLRDQSVGENGGSVPRWKVVTTLAYDSDRLSGSLTARSVSDGVYDRIYGPLDIDNNKIAGATYVDMALSYRFPDLRGSPEVFLNIENLFNNDPVIVAPQAQQQFVSPSNAALYDVLGRVYRTGVRLRF